MGTGSSLVPNGDSDDDLAEDELGEELGVLKNIPVECSAPQRKSVSLTNPLRSVGSFGKKKSSSSKGKIITKSSSLRSALSFDFDSEVDKLRKEYEFFRFSKQDEVTELQVAKQKLQSENRRLRGELKVLQATCLKLRNEREIGLEAEEQALQRALAFEKERDKVQRQFKLYRETKEKEIQEHLQSRRELEKKIQHMLNVHGLDVANTDGDLMGEGNNVTNDWWMSSLGSEQSLEELSQASILHGPDYSQAIMERDGAFTTVSRDDWNAALLQPSSANIQKPLESPVIRIYMSAPKEMAKEMKTFKEIYLEKLESMCEDNGYFVVLIHLEESGETLSEEEFSELLHLRQDQIKKCKVFLAFLGRKSNKFTYDEFQHGHLANPEKNYAIFCFKKPKKDSFLVDDETINMTEGIKKEVRKSKNLKLFDNFENAEEGAQLAYVEISRYLKKIMDVSDGNNTMRDTDKWVDPYGFHSLDEQEQLEALKAAAYCPYDMDFTKYFSELNVHLSSTGLLFPMLVMGTEGSGKSHLLAKWINLQQTSMPGRLMLYHFVGTSSSSSACPILMLRRLTLKLMRYMTASNNLPSDPVNLEEEFLRCLEKVSSKVQGGVTIVIDSADRLQDLNSHMQWLLDPLPVGTRVILSVNSNTCPQAWKLWPTLNIQSIIFTESKKADIIAAFCKKSVQDLVSKAVLDCSSDAVRNPRFLYLLASEINSCRKNSTEFIEQKLAKCLSMKDNLELLRHILEMTSQNSTDTSEKLKQILQHIALSRNGLTESEIFSLVPMGWTEWLQLLTLLQDKHIVTTRVGLIVLENQQIHDAISVFYRLDEDATETRAVQQRLISFYNSKIRKCRVTHRLIDEMPWLLQQTSQKEKLKDCLLDMNVFTRFFERGRVCELVQYWKYIGEEQSHLGKLYLGVINNMEGVSEDPSASVAELFVAVGLFLKCLGLLSQAAPPLHKALEIRETVLDPDHPLVAHSLHHLAELYAHWGNFSAAEAFYKQAIENTQNIYGLEHHSLVKDLEGLSLLYKKNEKYSLAEVHHKRAMSIRRKTGAMAENQNLKQKMLQVEELVLGPASSEVAKSLNELGVLLYLQNNHEAAQSFLQRALDMREEVLGKDHPDVAQSLHNLAALHNDLKMGEKAEPLYERALEIRMKTLPPHHASLASTVKHLAVLYRKLGKYAKAEPLYRQALEAREKVLGENHPSVGTALNNLAVVLCLQNKQSEALPLYERALRIYEERLGTNHPRVAEALVNLAKLYYDQGLHETAVRFYKQASDIQNRESHLSPRTRPNSVGAFDSTCKRPSSFCRPDAMSVG
ncbi:nephrocystin-3-like isoform X2 [Actinia tenebrosa]|uniref:Nephrocystin-3 n=1 Tax=Actinia tenebrosa TaxID=6105 RepID=A0A6P8J7Q1_ACTTE|nr:nephrocystin-3-like isoform X2 [Actinia tenebrosa]